MYAAQRKRRSWLLREMSSNFMLFLPNRKNKNVFELEYEPWVSQLWSEYLHFKVNWVQRLLKKSFEFSQTGEMLMHTQHPTNIKRRRLQGQETRRPSLALFRHGWTITRWTRVTEAALITISNRSESNKCEIYDVYKEPISRHQKFIQKYVIRLR
jgi:hypothetical protein